MDYFYINGIVFLHTKSKNIKKMTTHRYIGSGKEECIKKIDIITNVYTNRRFNITPYNGDNGFEILRERLDGANLNIVGRDDHIGAIERSIRTIKERARCICYKLPYKSYTKLITEEMILGDLKMNNLILTIIIWK